MHSFSCFVQLSLRGKRAALWILSLVVLGSVVTTALWPRPASAEEALDKSDEIVYIDNAQNQRGAIRVLDSVQGTGAVQIQWRSLETDFSDFALGDVNNDGDNEVIGIRGEGVAGQIVVYDPVVKTGTNDDFSNGIPWRKLATIPISGTPTLIAAGNFDPGVSGDEILVGYPFTNANNKFRIDVYKGMFQNHDGASWIKHIANRDFTNQWTDISVGDVITGGAPEVLLIDPASGWMRIFRPDNGFTGSCEYKRADAPVNDAVIAQWTPGDAAEIVMVRNYPTDPNVVSPRLLVSNCENNTLKALADEKFNPAPFHLFAGDVNANGDDEIFLLRELPAEATAAHLIGRAGGGGDALDLETALDKDNGFRAGAAGDVDGDGRDEVVIMRDTKIRIYSSPEVGANAKNLFLDYPLTTNRAAIEIGDLDKNGFTPPPLNFQLSHPVFPKQTNGPKGTLYLVNAGTQSALCTITFYNQIGQQTGNVVPCSLPANGQASFSATTLAGLPDGLYHLVVAASQPVESVVKITSNSNNAIGLYRGVVAHAEAQYAAPLSASNPRSLLTLAATKATSATVSLLNLSGVQVHQSSVSLPTNGFASFNLATLPSVPTDFRGWARITVTPGLVSSVVAQYDSSGGALYQDEPLPVANVISADGQPPFDPVYAYLPRIFKSVAEDGKPALSTFVFIGNLGLQDSAVINFRDPVGLLLASSGSQPLPPNGGVLFDPRPLATLANGVHSAIISATTPLLVSELTVPDSSSAFLADGYGAFFGASSALGAVAATVDGGDGATAAFRINAPYVVHNDDAFSLLSVQNNADFQTSLVVQFYRPDGQMLGTQTDMLAPKGWKRYDLRSLVPKGTVGHAVIIATQSTASWVDVYPLTPITTPQALTGVTVAGTSIAQLNQPITLTASAAPLSATLPIVYRWQSAGLTEQTFTSALRTQPASFAWPTPGIKFVAVSASNAHGTVSATHTIFVAASNITANTDQSATLVYSNGLGLTSTLELPTNAVSQTIRLSFVPVEGEFSPPAGLIYAKHQFELVVEVIPAEVEAAQLENYLLNRPALLTLRYRDADVAQVAEGELIFMLWTGSQWVDATTTCSPATTYTRDTTNNLLSVPLCQMSRYALFGPAPKVYLPLVVQSGPTE